ncbi:hypothetical protein JW865_06650 [Candidatus Bathyarchaeota archaeon]|nr:hypothetical protein [Candidatus Bathyarchaeota archaeon]
MIQIEYLPIILTGIGIIVSVLYYAMVLRNSNITRQAQLFSQIYLVFHQDYPKYSVILLDWDYENYKDFMEKYGRQVPERYGDWLKLCSFLEGLGVLVKRGLTNKHLVGDFMSGYVVKFWIKFEPLVLEIRQVLDWPSAYEHIEYLYKEMEPIYRKKT